MRHTSLSASSDLHCKNGAHVIGACDAWKDAEIITPDQQATIAEVLAAVQARVDDVRAKATTTKQAAEVTSKARARFGVRDVVLNLRVNAASDALLNGPALRSRTNKLYRTIFLGGTASDITGEKPREKPEQAGRVRENIATGPDFPARAGALAGLDEAIAASVAARTALNLAESAEHLAVSAEMMARLALRETLEQGYGKLRTAFPGHRDFVESFFPKRKKADASADEQGEEAPDEDELEAEAQAEAHEES